MSEIEGRPEVDRPRSRRCNWPKSDLRPRPRDHPGGRTFTTSAPGPETGWAIDLYSRSPRKKRWATVVQNLAFRPRSPMRRNQRSDHAKRDQNDQL